MISFFKNMALFAGLLINFLIRLAKKFSHGRGSITVLLFHNIKKEQWEKFHKLILFFKKYYEFIGPDFFEQLMHGKMPIDKNYVLITFDDGFKSSKEITEACLGPLGIKAAFFVCPQFIQLSDVKAERFIKENLFDGQYPYEKVTQDQMPMSLEDLKTLKRDGHYIGSHTYSHRRLSQLVNPEERSKEIIHSKEILQKMLGFPIEWFAYPFGNIESIDAESLKLISQNYVFCFSGVRGENFSSTKPYGVKRESINLDGNLFTQKFVGLGGLSPYYRNKRKILDNLI